MIKKYFQKRYYILVAATLILFLSFLQSWRLEKSYQIETAKFEAKLDQKILLLKKETFSLKELSNSTPVSILKKYNHQKAYLKDADISLFIFQKNNLIFWTQNAIPISDLNPADFPSKGILKLKNGWYYVIKTSVQDKWIIGLNLIKSDFILHNQYLPSAFEKDFDISSKCQIDLKQTAYQIHDLDGTYLFSLAIGDNKNAHFTSIWIVVLFFIGFFLFVYTSHCWFDYLFKNKHSLMGVTIFSLLLIGFRIVMVLFHIPDYIYNQILFSPYKFADSTLIPSLGDLLLNAFIIFYISYLYSKTNLINQSKYLIIKTSILFLMVSFISLGIKHLIGSLVLNSSLYFDLNNIFGITWLTILALLVLGIILASLYLIANTICNFFIHQSGFQDLKGINLITKRKFLISYGSSILLFLICIMRNMDWVLLLFWTALILILILLNVAKKFPLTRSLALLFLFSAFVTYYFQQYNREKEHDLRKLYLSKLSQEKDPLAEARFDEVASKIKNDSLILHQLLNYEKNEELITQHIEEEYLSGYWNKFDLSLYICQKMDTLLIDRASTSVYCINFFNDMVAKNGDSTLSKHLWRIRNTMGKVNYLGNISFEDKSINLPKTEVFINLTTKSLTSQNGFPEILLDENYQSNIDFTKYSMALYKNNQLISFIGDYAYGINGKEFGNFKTNEAFFDKNDFSHLCFKNNDLLYIISKKRDPSLNYLTMFSYIFLFITLLLLMGYSVRFVMVEKRILLYTLKSKIQLSLIAILLLSVILTGGGTIYYFYYQFEKQNQINVKEKTASVLMELEDKLAHHHQIRRDNSEHLTYLLQKLSNTFYTDINLYGLTGKLIATSRSRIYEEGLISKEINTKALEELLLNNSSQYIQDERIGNMTYLSAYVPIRNGDNKVIGYLNIPYFAKQAQANKEISTLILAIINIYVLLIIVSLMLTIFVVNRLTKSLKIIELSISNIKLGKKNQRIEWRGNDEIGELILEYNLMIEELAKSAELLAKSERESAWREMAKQVAHEIKNPLTPMKLTTQYLQRSFDAKDPDIKDKITSFTQTIIQQIDTLSSIASAFSDFARWPKPAIAPIEISSFISNAIHLYNDTDKIKFVYHPANELYLNADKELLLRVFNNILSNAIYAIEEKYIDDEGGMITITIEEKTEQVLIMIADNGMGMNDEQREKVFVPSFTTKSRGMGLGMAMVKNIIDSFEGKIWFESTENEGTVFFIELAKGTFNTLP